MGPVQGSIRGFWPTTHASTMPCIWKHVACARSMTVVSQGPNHSSTIRCLRTCMPLVHFCAHTQDDHREPKGDRCRRKSNDTSTHIHERKADHGEPKGRQTALSHAHTKAKLIKVPCWSISQQGTLKKFIFGFRGSALLWSAAMDAAAGPQAPLAPSGNRKHTPLKF